MTRPNTAISAFNFLKRIKAAMVAFRDTSNRYEAAIPYSPDRPYVPAFVRDARIDANAFSRWELCRKARYERRNNWLMKRLQSVDVKYTVGPHGHVVIPQSSNPEWNKRMQDAYHDWCEMPFRDSALPMSQGHHLLRKEMHVDGEVYENCTYLKIPGQRAIPAIELVESHRVSSPGVDYDYPQDITDMQDGVQFSRDATGDVYGRPTGFHVRLGVEGQRWTLAPSFNPYRPIDGGMIRICDPDRIGMARVVSEYAPVLNEIADLFFLTVLELDKAKANSEYAAILETWDGELPSDLGRGIKSSSYGKTVPGSTNNDADVEKRLNQMRKVISAKMAAIKPGEKWNWTKSETPSAATQWLWKFFIERVCVSRDIPMILVLPESMQGTVSRAVMDDAQIGFTLQFGINARAAKQSYRFYADWARYNVPGLTDAPADWQKCQVVPPPSINVDFGRNMAAMLAGIEAGVYDYDDVIGRDGGTAEGRFRRKAINIAKAKQIAAEVSKSTGVEVKAEEIIGSLADVAEKMAAANAADANPEEVTTQ